MCMYFALLFETTLDFVKSELLESSSICSMMNKCQVDDESANECEYCKHLLRNVQKAIFAPNTIVDVDEYPQLTNVLKMICQWFNIDCSINFNGILFIQQILSFELDDQSIEKLCRIFKQC